jgi:hypothetical protein
MIWVVLLGLDTKVANGRERGQFEPLFAKGFFTTCKAVNDGDDAIDD